MSRLSTFLPAAALLLPLPVGAAPFSGFAVGAGATNHSLNMDATFDLDNSTRSETVSEFGPFVDIGYGIRASRSIHVQAGVRAHDVELEANLYDDDCVKAESHTAAYGQIGYIFGDSNMVYGIFESGSADVLVATEDYPNENFDASTFAFGLGYKRGFGDSFEVFVEGTNRTYDNLHIHYDGGEYDGAKKDIDLDSTNLTTGVMYRF